MDRITGPLHQLEKSTEEMDLEVKGNRKKERED